MNAPTSDQINAAVRYGVAVIGSIVATLGSIHFLKGGDVTALSGSLTQLGTAVTALVTAVATIAPVIAGVIGTMKSSPIAQIQAVAANPDVQKVVTTAEIANATPSNKIVAK